MQVSSKLAHKNLIPCSEQQLAFPGQGFQFLLSIVKEQLAKNKFLKNGPRGKIVCTKEK